MGGGAKGWEKEVKQVGKNCVRSLKGLIILQNNNNNNNKIQLNITLKWVSFSDFFSKIIKSLKLFWYLTNRVLCTWFVRYQNSFKTLAN